MKINVVVALAAAVSVIAAPSKKQLECKPHEEVTFWHSNITVLTKGFLMLYAQHPRDNSSIPFGGPVGTLQPSDGKLKVSTLSKDELKKEGKQFQLMSCNVKGEEYDDKVVPYGVLQNETVVRGQLRTGDECLAERDGEVKLEKCATTEEELKPQIFASGELSLVKVHGENATTLIVDVKDGAVTNMREMKNESDIHYLRLVDMPVEDLEGLGHDGSVQVSVTMAGLVVALAVAWVLV